MDLQVIVMTSDASMERVLPGFCYLFDKYWKDKPRVKVCGYSTPSFQMPDNFTFYSIGDFKLFPAKRWSDSFKRVLDNEAEEIFFLLMDDFWLCREVNTQGVIMMRDYMRQFKNVIKMDTSFDRLYVDPGRHVYGFNGYASLGYLDLIKSVPASPYHMSLWGGLWSRDNLLKVLIPGETAQEIELEGTHRLSTFGDDLLVFGTRQAPVIHGNILQSSKTHPVFSDGGWRIEEPVLRDMREAGLLKGLE